jgi:Prokaryotic membrane lipoprotein lipid attachment site
MRKTILLAVAALALAGCDYGQTRSSFQLKVAGKTLDEAIAAAGKPARQEARATGETVLVYEKKTFDAENMNAKDAAVHVTFKQDSKTGQFEYRGIEFVPL